jgi:hypothetical protein
MEYIMKSLSIQWLKFGFRCALLCGALVFSTGAYAQLSNGDSNGFGAKRMPLPETTFGNEAESKAQIGTAVAPVKAEPMPLGDQQISSAQKARVEYWTNRLPLRGPSVLKTGNTVPPPPDSETDLGGPQPNAPSTLQIWRNANLLPIIPGGFSSSTNEPSTAMSGRNRFQTGNWYAAYSSNAGNNWTHLSPFTAFPSVDGGFCCDQDVIYDPSRGMFLWLLQYIKSGNTVSDNGSFRIAVFNSQTANLSNSGWYTYTFNPTMFGGGGGEWFDYPHLALSNDFLYIAINVFTTTSDTWTRTLIIRLPLGQLRNATTVFPGYWSQSSYFNFTPVQGTKDTMYFASQISNSQMAIFRWPEGPGNGIIYTSVRNVPAWTSGVLHQCPATGGNDWCQRADSRILAAAIKRNPVSKENELWFFWNVAQGGGFPYPYINAARFLERNFGYVGRPALWSTQTAWHYIGAAPNARGDLAVSAAYAHTPNRNPGSVICLLDDFVSNWECKTIRTGSFSPSSNRWGDYLRVRPADPFDYSWTATTFTLQSGTATGNAEPRNLVFGRARDASQRQRWFAR